MERAIVYTEFGGPEVLHEIEIPVPTAGEGQVVVRVEAAGVNPIDLKLRSGLRASAPPSAEKPRRVGSDAAGTITAVGEGVDGFRIGDAVVVSGGFGAYASAIAVSAAKVFARPRSVDAATGAAIGIPWGTAYQSLRSLGVGPGDTLLVHAGSGAVGQAAIQFALRWGATVIATASPKRFDRVRALGAVPVAYGPGLVDRVRDAAPEGVSVVLDAAGTDEAIEASLELAPDRHRIATIVRGADAAGYGIRAFSGGSPEPLTDQQSAWRVEAVPVTLAMLAAGALDVEPGRSFPLRDAAAAHTLVANGATGKVTLLP